MTQRQKYQQETTISIRFWVPQAAYLQLTRGAKNKISSLAQLNRLALHNIHLLNMKKTPCGIFSCTKLWKFIADIKIEKRTVGGTFAATQAHLVRQTDTKSLVIVHVKNAENQWAKLIAIVRRRQANRCFSSSIQLWKWFKQLLKF